MSKHTPQWRLDIAMMVEALEHAQEAIAWHNAGQFEDQHGRIVERVVDLAIDLGKQYAPK